MSDNKIPSKEEYDKAKEIVIAYEAEEKRLHDIKVEAFRKDLQEYFDNNLIDGRFKLKKFELGDGWAGGIIPIDPPMEENYEGGNNEDIAKLCEKHGVDFRIIYWCYHK